MFTKDLIRGISILRLPVVCCAALICFSQWPTAAAQSDADQPDADQQALAIINDRPLSARVLGGGDAEIGDYPSVVALISAGSGSLQQRLFCGGTVVSERWVLTAAHCMTDVFNLPLQPESVRVVAGINDLAQEVPDSELNLIRIILHPDYDSSMALPPNDLALLELSADLPVPKTTLFTGETQNFTGTPGFIAGWGAIEYSDPINAVFPSVLQDAIVPLVSNETCNAPESYDGLILDTHVCAGFVDGMVDACAGDSGGPLFITVDGIQVQAGVTSFGIGCGLPLFYGIYTNVSHFIPWLAEYIEVPFQAPEVVAARDTSGTESVAHVESDSSNGLFGAAFGFPGAMVLLFMLMARRKCNSACHLNIESRLLIQMLRT